MTTLTVKQVMTKARMGLKLTGAENRLWETAVRQQLLRYRETYHADADGSVHVHRTADAEPVMDGVRMMDDSQLQSPLRDRNGRLYLGSVDHITAVNWAKECGHPLYSKEWREYAKSKLMSGEFSKFRASRTRSVFHGHDLSGVQRPPRGVSLETK